MNVSMVISVKSSVCHLYSDVLGPGHARLDQLVLHGYTLLDSHLYSDVLGPGHARLDQLVLHGYTLLDSQWNLKSFLSREAFIF